MRLSRLALLAGLTAAAPAAAAPFIFSGYVEGRLGYVTDPFLSGQGGGSGLAGVTLAPVLTQTTSLGQTTVQGNYDREQYFSRFGYSETYGVDLTHAQRLSERLTGQVHAGYVNTNNATVSGNFDPVLNDLFTVGQRSWRVSGDGSLDWTATMRDRITASVNATRVVYTGDRLFASDYDQFGGTLDYLHTLTGRTKIGGTVSYVRYLSKDYPDSSSLQPGIKIQQDLSGTWTFNGDVGVILQKIDGDSRTSTSLGFHASLCGKYPLSSLCVRASRASSGTGIGGLSRTTAFGADYSRRLSEHETFTLSGDYEKTSYAGSAIGAVDATFVSANAGYSRDLTRRLSAGVSGRYQLRTTGNYGTEHSIAATVNIRMKIGRIS